MRNFVRHIKAVWRRLALFFFNLLSGPLDQFVLVEGLRRGILRLIGLHTEAPFHVDDEFYVYWGRNLRVEAGCRLGCFTRIWDFCPIHIGKNLLASHNLTIISASHDLSDLRGVPGPVHIGDDVWIGINVTIVGPVRIGDRAVIGAGSVVLKDVPANTIVAGVPAKFIRTRSPASAEQQ